MIKRINEKVDISFEQISYIFNKVMGLEVMNSLFMIDGGSTTNYKITTHQGSFLFKLYPARRDNSAEIKLMTALEKDINIPKIYTYDNSRELFSTDFLISDFIEGTSFRDYTQVYGISKEHASALGKTLSVIHSQSFTYPHNFDKAQTPVKSIIEQYKYFIKSIAGRHIGNEYCEYMKDILNKNLSELKCVNDHTVRTHGDVNPGNILVDHNKELWFIDFEYGHATTPFLDFGKFLRKRNDFSCYLTQEVLENIKNAYEHPLQDNWIHLSMLVDIPALLRMINIDSPNPWRVEYIQKRIKDLHQDLDKLTYTFKLDNYKS